MKLGKVWWAIVNLSIVPTVLLPLPDTTQAEVVELFSSTAPAVPLDPVKQDDTDCSSEYLSLKGKELGKLTKLTGAIDKTSTP